MDPYRSSITFSRNGDDIRYEQLRDIALVVVVDLERPVEPALTRPNRGLGLDDDKRNAVHQQNEIGALFRRASATGELCRDDILIALKIGELNKTDGDVLAISTEGHGPFACQPRGHLLVGFD